MRREAVRALVLLGVVGGFTCWLQGVNVKPPAEPHLRVPVATNRGPEVMSGFQGGVHPLLHGRTSLEVTAHWECKNSRDILAGAPYEVRRLFQTQQVAVPVKSYSKRDFSGFLPDGEPTRVGQVWALNPNTVAHFLKQFHAAASLRTASAGKRPGPDGAFAVLRAVSSSHLDIVFRVHAEFNLLPAIHLLPIAEASYTPACFLGRLVLNRSAGTIESFRMGVPTDNTKNVHITASDYDHDLIYVDRMELTGGVRPDGDTDVWMDQIEMAQAYDQLARVFYQFKEINWVAFDRTLSAARAQKKPIFAVVLWGALDDQSC